MSRYSFKVKGGGRVTRVTSYRVTKDTHQKIRIKLLKESLLHSMIEVVVLI